MTIAEEELFGALRELMEASQAMVEAQHGNDQDIWVISDRYDDSSVPRTRRRTPVLRGGATRKMRAGPSKSVCRSRLQTTSSCMGKEPL